MKLEPLRLREDSKSILISDDCILDVVTGDITPEDFLDTDSAERVNTAVELLYAFEKLLIDKGILEYDGDDY